MFTEQTQYLSALPSAKSPQELGQLVADLLGQCQLPLRHEGDIEVRNLKVNGTITGGSASFSYAVAQGTWVRASGDGSYVTCRAASDPTGTLTADATTFTVYLPRWIASKDPNVYSGDVLQYVTIGGTNYAVGESYLDDKIGTLRAMTIGTEYNGWELCDGNGSTDDFVGLFVRGAATYGTTGGADTHGHTGSVTVATTSLSITGDTGSGQADIGDHPDHVHQQDGVCHIIETGGTYYGYSTDDPHYTGGVLDTSYNPLTLEHVDGGHTHDAGTLAISPNPHGHSGSTITINNGNNVPAYIEVVWFVRVGPSGEIT